MEKIDYSQGWVSHNKLPLDEALKHGIVDCECYVYRISIPVDGGATYIGFTSQDPKVRLSQHLDSARSDSFHNVHKELRKFGFMHEFEVIGKYNNEVIALISEIATIQKYSPTLNRTIGGEGNRYSVILELNHLNEEVFFVQDNLAIKRHNDELDACNYVLEKLTRVGYKVLHRHERRSSISKSKIISMFDNHEVALALLNKIFISKKYEFDDLFTDLSGDSHEIYTRGKALLLAQLKELTKVEQKMNLLIDERDSEFSKSFIMEVEQLSKVDNYLELNGFGDRNLEVLYDFLPTSDCKAKHYWTESRSIIPFKSQRQVQNFILKIRNDGIINHKAISGFTLAWHSSLGLTSLTKARFHPDGRKIWLSGRDVFTNRINR
jgi:hypothetical protein